jgi:hypothetical protein
MRKTLSALLLTLPLAACADPSAQEVVTEICRGEAVLDDVRLSSYSEEDRAKIRDIQTAYTTAKFIYMTRVAGDWEYLSPEEQCAMARSKMPG